MFSGLTTKPPTKTSPAKEEVQPKKKDLYGGFIDLNNLGKNDEDDKPSYLKKSTGNSGGVYIKDQNTN